LDKNICPHKPLPADRLRFLTELKVARPAAEAAGR